jgi:histidinol-phosphate/aromatic aminotransferase/cobyric acid decarboxylase-like protein
MKIANKVKNLFEVGYPVTSRAEALDRRQIEIEKLQAELDKDRQEFFKTVRELWTAEEREEAGLFIG